MDREQLDPKLEAVLVHLCKRRGSLSKTQAVKLPYLVDVIANQMLGARITKGEHQNWKWGVVTADVWHFAKPGTPGPFLVQMIPYTEGSVSISATREASEDLSQDELEIVDFVADEYGALDYGQLGELTKAMNPEVDTWGSSEPASVDEDAYTRLSGRYDSLLRRVYAANADDRSKWVELSGTSTDELRKSLNI